MKALLYQCTRCWLLCNLHLRASRYAGGWRRFQIGSFLAATQANQQGCQVLANGHRQRMGDAPRLPTRFQCLLIEISCLLVPSLSLAQARELAESGLQDGGHRGICALISRTR